MLLRKITDCSKDALVLLALILALCSSSVWGRLYHQNNTPDFLTALILSIWIFSLILILSLSLLYKPILGRLFIRSFILGSTFILLASLFYGKSIAITNSSFWIFPVSLTIGLFGYFVICRFDEFWLNFRRALSLAILIFISSGPIIGSLNSKNYILLPSIPDSQRLPTIWLLLDETSAGALDQLSEPLLRQGLKLKSAALTPSGSNTIDIVPSIITRRYFGHNVYECGWRMLCGEEFSLDFKKVHVGRDHVDIIGAYHPWCSISGWRSCFSNRRDDPTWDQQIDNILCTLRKIIKTSDECNLIDVVQLIRAREEALEAERESTFWYAGGDLIMHILLPHLPFNDQIQPSLAVAYQMNLNQASLYLEDLAIRLNQKYPKGFRLVVFSDHPLRPTTRCSDFYSNNCQRPVKYAEPYKVPLIIASPDTLPEISIETNLNVFDLDLRSLAIR